MGAWWKRHPSLHVPGRLGPRCPWASLEPPAARVTGLSAVSICSQAGAPSQHRPPLQPALPRGFPTSPAAWEFFPIEACPSPPYFNKSSEEGQGIPPSSSYTSQPVPHLLCPPSLAWPGKAAGSQALAAGRAGSPGHAQSSSTTPPLIQTGRQAGAYLKTPAGGKWPSACLQVLARECHLHPPATLWSGIPKNCKSQTHPPGVYNLLRNGISEQKAIRDQTGIW